MIAIIGAGKLGKLIANELEQRHEYYSTNTTGHDGYKKFDINSDSFTTLPLASTYIINIPPSKINFDSFIKNVKSIKHAKIIFISSTSVYGDFEGIVDELTKPNPKSQSANKLVRIENILLTQKESLIIRPAGLYDKDSHPGFHLSGKDNIKNYNHPVNLISREDVASAIVRLLNTEIQLINLVNVNHPKKQSYYTEFCRSRGLDTPRFSLTTNGRGKEVKTKYVDFQFNSPLP